MPKMIFVNLAVADVEKSAAFYKPLASPGISASPGREARRR